MKRLLAAAVLAVHTTAAAPVIVQREAYVMGTRVALLAVDDARVSGLRKLDDALSAIEEVDRELSTWRPDTPLARLNASPVGRPFEVDTPICAVLKEIAFWQRQTAGAFDPAIGPLLDAWGVHRGGRIPAADELSRARARSGMHLVALDAARCAVIRLGPTAIDAGAFGKGAALDRAARSLATTAAWMIDLGGQVAAHGAPPEQRGWPVAIAHPGRRQEPFLTARIRSGSLATSGGSERDTSVGGRRVGHIVDPRIGAPAPFDGSVTVWHQRALVADILSTALFVMGPSDGLGWAEARGVAACYLVPDAAGGVGAAMTAAFRTAVISSQ